MICLAVKKNKKKDRDEKEKQNKIEYIILCIVWFKRNMLKIERKKKCHYFYNQCIIY